MVELGGNLDDGVQGFDLGMSWGSFHFLEYWSILARSIEDAYESRQQTSYYANALNATTRYLLSSAERTRVLRLQIRLYAMRSLRTI